MTTVRLPLNTALQTTAARLLTPAPARTCAGRIAGSTSVGPRAYSQSCTPRQHARQAALREPFLSPKPVVPGRRNKSPFCVLSPRTPWSGKQGRALYSTQPAVSQEPTIHSLFETKTGTWQYVVVDPSTLNSVIIDPVLDYDPSTRTITTQSADALLSVVKENGYKVQWILETHAHADHLTAAYYLQKQLAEQQGYRPPIGIGKRITQVQKLFGGRYGIPAKEYEGNPDKLFDDDEVFEIGDMKATAIHLPGHTPDHLGYKIGDNVFCGDSIFHVDIGTARCDFPGGSVNNLWKSARKLLAMPDHVKIWTGHDYPPDSRGKPVAYMTVKEHKEQNKHLKDGVTEEEFVALRKERDAMLGEPRLLHQSLQINIRGGHLPEPTEVGHRLLHLPLKVQGVKL
ncbi:Metallo-hydrolase/oxidoreductase [Lojkania enalia]|uniref:Metallo-hydrolase/oxidoreductase n=1 Tax=Lojkania enalia TaxID=147567 RepID=A0A9P4N4Z5_9PLEO|nr:Metallo-hydrolase/oxidoreductase [Didymosphaeria enalia]